MKKIFFLSIIMFAAAAGNAQLTYQHTYSWNNLSVVNLLLSGKKYCNFQVNQVTLYNLNHSVWKTITFPTIPGFYTPSLQTPPYISENLFKIDNKVDMVLCYGDSTYLSGGGSGPALYVVIDETGAIVSRIDSAAYGFEVHSIGVDSFVAFVPIFNTADIKVYSLPGKIPCDICGSGLGLGVPAGNGSGNTSSLLSAPVPNPSSNEAKIEYKLSAGTTGVIRIFSQMGQEIKSYKVDSNFGYITIDNSDLPAGMYYYNLTTTDGQTNAKKMLIIK